MWRLSALFVVLTLGVTAWLSYELDLFTSGSVEAAESAKAQAQVKAQDHGQAQANTPKISVDTASDKQLELETLRMSLERRSHELEVREAELNKRAQALADKESLMNNQVGRYEKSIEGLKTQLARSEKQQDAKVESFRHVYEKMEGKAAARILDEMDLGLATSILGGMKQDKAAEILSHMSANRARLITEKFLGVSSANPSASSKRKVNPETGPRPASVEKQGT